MSKNVYKCMGARNGVITEREPNDFYATEPKATKLLLELESFSQDVWEPACGKGHISKILEETNIEVYSSDLIDRGFGDGGIDFLKIDDKWNGDIITNPPFKYALEFIEKSLEKIPVGNKVAMFLKLHFLEGKKRGKFFKENPPIRVWVSSSRLCCSMNAQFEKHKAKTMAYAWYIWEKGFKGKTELDWFNQ